MDAAVSTGIARIKTPGNPLEGETSILAFPDLDAANIGSKLVKLFGNAKLIGPVIFGRNKPHNDISQGANEYDVCDRAIVRQFQAG